MNYADALAIIVAVLAGGAGGSLLTIDRYHRVTKERAAYEEELAQSQDVLAALALLRRVRARRYRRPAPPEE
jgi:hypothetical protein